MVRAVSSAATRERNFPEGSSPFFALFSGPAAGSNSSPFLFLRIFNLQPSCPNSTWRLANNWIYYACAKLPRVLFQEMASTTLVCRTQLGILLRSHCLGVCSRPSPGKIQTYSYESYDLLMELMHSVHMVELSTQGCNASDMLLEDLQRGRWGRWSCCVSLGCWVKCTEKFRSSN